MATLVLGAVGASLGGSLGGSILGLSGAVLGRAVGATVGRVIDQSILGGGSEAVEVGRLDRLRLTGASEGAVIPRIAGRVRVGGQVIWATRFKENRSQSGGGGKGAPSAPKQTTFSYSVSLALALCEGEITRVGRIWADGSEIARNSIQLRVHSGADDQLPDALIEAIEGRGHAPAYRGTAYVVIEDLDLTPFGNRVPQLSFEVVRTAMDPTEVSAASQLIRGVALVPGTGEYALATTAVHYDFGGGEKDSANINTPQGISDMRVAMRDLTEELPNLSAVSLIVSWFGDDLRCGECRITPRIEQRDVDGSPQQWNVCGLGRTDAPIVPMIDDRPVYGGTPGDASVIEAIRDLNSRGIEVTFYPFLLMTQLAGNERPDPWGGTEQAALPWRGRITSAVAPQLPGTTDRTVRAEEDVERFFGNATAADFETRTDGMGVDGPREDWSYRTFILHYAKLCAIAGGVEAFCIGSEMRGLTQIRGGGDRFPTVDALRDLAREVRSLLPDAKIGYAADWSEYSNYRPEDTGNLHFHLDPLWGDPNIDFVGIDNYMPLSDWRDGRAHLDAGHRSIYDLEYLAANVEGGEGFDWYYPDEDARRDQRRVAITDGAYSEPWVYRYKDVRSWWTNSHHDRIGGVRTETPTSWVPGSKPIRFVEYGCAAIDKGANQPNKFIDTKSSESSLPYYSNGGRDDTMQQQYLRAFLDHWGAREAERVRAGEGPMIDLAHSFAWAWDTRPWPAFPQLGDYWTDAVNYARGHWLTGRSSNQPLATVIREICRSTGLKSVDTTAVHGIIRGYVMSAIQTARADLQPLLIAHGVEATEWDGKIAFAMREDARPAVLSTEQVVREEGSTIARHRAPSAETARRILIHHVDMEDDFAVTVADAVLPGTQTLPLSETELPLALTSSEGRSLAERFLTEAQLVRDTIDFSLPPSRRDLRAGDHFRFAGEAEYWRIDRLDEAESRRVHGVRTELSVFDVGDDAGVGPVRARPAVPLPVDATFLELPLLAGDEDPYAPYVAVSAKPWPGAVAIHSAIDDSDYRLNRLVEAPVITGTTMSPLHRAMPSVIDAGPDLLVRIGTDALSSVSEKAFLAGANAAAVGDGSLVGWEIIQFRDARPVGNGVWALSHRLRGQRGTEWAMRDVRPAGSRVILLDQSLPQIVVTPGMLGLTRDYRIGPATLPLSDPRYRHFEIATTGEALRPYAPAHLRVKPVEGGHQISWIRRTRLAAAGWDVPDVPLGETREAYVVRLIEPGGSLVFEQSTIASEFFMSEARMGDLQQNLAGCRIEVAQVSDEIGPGHAAVHVFV